jgi:hypothetical protein
MMGTKKVGASAGPRTEAKLIVAQAAGSWKQLFMVGFSSLSARWLVDLGPS